MKKIEEERHAAELVSCLIALQGADSLFLAHQIEKSDVLPHVRNSYLTLVISPRSHPTFKCSFLTFVVKDVT